MRASYGFIYSLYVCVWYVWLACTQKTKLVNKNDTNGIDWGIVARMFNQLAPSPQMYRMKQYWMNMIVNIWIPGKISKILQLSVCVHVVYSQRSVKLCSFIVWLASSLAYGGSLHIRRVRPYELDHCADCSVCVYIIVPVCVYTHCHTFALPRCYTQQWAYL